MIINNVSNFDEEPMEVDPGTPLFTRQLAPQQNKDIQNQTPVSPNTTKTTGPKIVKPIRPPARVSRPSSENGDKTYEFDENINPFQSKPKIGFDSATSSSSSISNENNSEYFLKEDINPFNSRRGLTRSPSPSRLRVQQEENCPNTTNEDEWESHKKRSGNSSRRSNQPSSPTANQSTSVSVVSSTTDLSSTSSVSPQEMQKEHPDNTESKDLNDPFQTPQKTNKFASRKSLSTTLTDNDDNTTQFSLENSNHNTSVNTSSFLPPDSVIFDSIFSNESEFQSFLDLLEKKEKDNTVKKSPTKFSEFARKSLYLQFDPIIQNCRSLSPEKIKRLSIIRDKQESIKFFLSEIVEEENEQTPSTNATSTDNQSLVDTNTIKSDLVNNENTHKNINVTRRSSIAMDNSTLTNQADNSEIKSEFQSTINPDEHFGEKNFSQADDSKRKSSLCSSISLDHSKINENGPNSSILDLDRMHISRKTNPNETTESFRLLTDESMLDDIHLLNKSNPNNSVNSKPRVQMTKSLEKKCNSSLTSSVTSVTGLSDDDTSLNPSMSKLIAELSSAREREKSYLDQIRSLDEENKKFQVIVVEFETIIQNMDNNREENETKLRSEILELTKERDHLQEDVIGVERAFDDLHRRFEKLKIKVEEFKKNEDGLQHAIESYKQQLDKERVKYSTLKKHAEEKLEFANNEIENLRKSTSIELQTLRAELRKAEIKTSSLELTVQQKDQENNELTNLLEDLLSKVKPNQK